MEQNQTAKKTFPAVTIQGNLASDAELRFIPAKKEGQKPRAVLEFRVVVNPTREALKAVGVDCALFGKRAEVFKDQLTKGTSVELSGDIGLEAYLSKDKQEPRANLKMEVVFGTITTFDADKKPTKVKLAVADEGDQQ